MPKLKVPLIIVVVLILITLLCLPRIYLYKGQQEKIIYSRFMFPGQMFVFKYNHSVQKTPVYEYYTVDWRGKIIMNKTRFKSYGAGLPLQTKNFSIEEENNFFKIDDMNIILPKVIFRISKTPGQTLKIVNKNISMNDQGKVGSKLTVRVKPFYKDIF